MTDWAARLGFAAMVEDIQSPRPWSAVAQYSRVLLYVAMRSEGDFILTMSRKPRGLSDVGDFIACSWAAIGSGIGLNGAGSVDARPCASSALGEVVCSSTLGSGGDMGETSRLKRGGMSTASGLRSEFTT